ncbi:hypothetical protein PIB30_061581 [Stylosanthes scabra]|uniref:Uncharacterized protein n=1 Tax=Stylosanthes scabra TaxID=79078 RepID=A0ABU6QL95_9FABA|nr:hypothetical protein [Stylosanthes scabra]
MIDVRFRCYGFVKRGAFTSRNSARAEFRIAFSFRLVFAFFVFSETKQEELENFAVDSKVLALSSSFCRVRVILPSYTA